MDNTRVSKVSSPLRRYEDIKIKRIPVDKECIKDEKLRRRDRGGIQ